MADLRILSQVAQSKAPYGRPTAVTTPSVVVPKWIKDGLSDKALEALGGMFDELGTDDDTEFLAQEKVLMDQMKYAMEQGKQQNPLTQRNMIDDVKQIEAKLKTLRDNPPKSSSLDRGVDTIKEFLNLASDDSDVYGISSANKIALNKQKKSNLEKIGKFYNEWGIA